MNDITTVMAEFAIIGENFTKQNITNQLQIEPTEFYSKGDKIKNRDLYRKETAWSLATEYEESLDINLQLNKLISILNDKKEELLKLKRTYNLFYKFFIVIKIEENETPAIYLDTTTISFANDLGIEFDFDLYIF
ncbi:DUF4279 domain-containing protein (plasmid) [Paenibacillus urinalis]|uniref:DUF4279 domain-containing protein n=1 Tax=Paenibacillus urinalis TaxID=521520 RepID=A0AAX3N753_9BACL|nr:MULTISPECIES: DUF4279 domain-containing protein [Paenibacillus]MCM3130555.1 DUF4279 domain-containing protein [Paenibacillus sp. MER 78]WDH85442.1 DUF4279 domain-containing protein [Paenibacillus urinalis]WDH95119.1 DUF4279 domain-containing protein [Paenibacillus urinalis]WDI05408.1 DUF4279 domain-containing protein [Paenibacillus urinalis]